MDFLKRPLVAFLSLAVLGGCGSTPTEVTPRTGFNLIGATVVSPNEPGWRTVVSNPGSVALGKAGNLQGESKIFKVSIVQIDSSLSDDSFLAEAKKAKSPAKTQKVNYKGTRCLKFEGSLQNTKAKIAGSGPVYETNIGYTCRHPLRKDVAIDMGYSSRATTTGLTAAERSQTKQFFDNIQFNENGF
ncbi:hypothetical protein SuNHUV7_06850 (plasmid) [Pseudoseohaeicola sp. NH-UV-7]|uniref:hypothetical protein n=1 Tax=Sulfitobacter sp. TBRI5 TaxID=2989732 RepID=UPI003A78087C